MTDFFCEIVVHADFPQLHYMRSLHCSSHTLPSQFPKILLIKNLQRYRFSSLLNHYLIDVKIYKLFWVALHLESYHSQYQCYHRVYQIFCLKAFYNG